MSNQERIEMMREYIQRVEPIEEDLDLCASEAVALKHMEDCVDAVYLAYRYGLAKGLAASDNVEVLDAVEDIENNLSACLSAARLAAMGAFRPSATMDDLRGAIKHLESDISNLADELYKMIALL